MIVFIDLLKLNGVLGGGWVAAVAECWQMSHPTWMASENSARHNVENSNNNNHQTESTTRNLFGSLSALLTQHQAGNDLHWLSGPQRPNFAAFVCSKKIIRADVYLLPVTRPILSFWLNKFTNYRNRLGVKLKRAVRVPLRADQLALRTDLASRCRSLQRRHQVFNSHTTGWDIESTFGFGR